MAAGAATQQQFPLQTGYSSLWIAVGGSSAARAPVFLPNGRAGGERWPGAAGTRLEVPHPNQRNRFVAIDTIEAQDQYPQITVVNLAGDRPSLLKELRRLKCPVTIYVPYGTCDDKSIFDDWTTVMTIVEFAKATDYTKADGGAMNSSQRATIDETATFEGLSTFDLGHITWSQKATALSTKPYVAVVVCDTQTCAGLCGFGSDGCQVIFALTAPLGGTPSGSAGVTFTANDWDEQGQSFITAFSTAAAVGLACVGTKLVAISSARNSLAYATLSEIITGTATWIEVTEGFVATKTPNAIFAFSPTQVYIVGNGGYIYSSGQITAGVVVDDPGSVTVENLNAVHSPDGRVVLIGGDADTILLSTDGGVSYQQVSDTGSTDDILAVFAKNANEFLVGTSGHEVFQTVNAGLTWSIVDIPGSGGTGTINKILFHPESPSLGWIADTKDDVGRVLRTYNGGFSWKTTPEDENRTMPTQAGLVDIALCADVNRIHAVGSATGGLTGILLRGAAA